MALSGSTKINMTLLRYRMGKAHQWKQWRHMLQKLIEERFQLKFHHDKRELSVYVLSVGKDGPKNLAKSVSTSVLPNFGFMPAPGGTTSYATNTTMGEYAQMLQEGVFDRPGPDQTGISGRYDLKFTFMPMTHSLRGTGRRLL